jgi:tRNA splicing endonuclease
MMDDVLDFYKEDCKSRMSDELFEAYLRGEDVRGEDDDRASSLDEDDDNEESLKSQCTGTDLASASKFTTSTKDSHKTGKKLKAYEALRDEGKVYKYEDDPKKYMRVRK